MDITTMTPLLASLRWQLEIVLSILAWTPEYLARRLAQRIARHGARR